MVNTLKTQATQTRLWKLVPISPLFLLMPQLHISEGGLLTPTISTGCYEKAIIYKQCSYTGKKYYRGSLWRIPMLNAKFDWCVTPQGLSWSSNSKLLNSVCLCVKWHRDLRKNSSNHTLNLICFIGTEKI